MSCSGSKREVKSADLGPPQERVAGQLETHTRGRPSTPPASPTGPARGSRMHARPIRRTSAAESAHECRATHNATSRVNSPHAGPVSPEHRNWPPEGSSQLDSIRRARVQGQGRALAGCRPARRSSGGSRRDRAAPRGRPAAVEAGDPVAVQRARRRTRRDRAERLEPDRRRGDRARLRRLRRLAPWPLGLTAVALSR